MALAIDLLAATLIFCFITCCIVSALLQLVAWWRHARQGVPVSLRALWRPEGHFDAVGLQQIRLARLLLTVGGVAYLTYGLMMVVANFL